MIDADGRTLMPGLIDAHVHAIVTSLDLNALTHRPATRLGIEAAAVLEGMLRRGFTTVREPALVGIDSVNIDDLADSARRAHTCLLGRGVLVLEHLTGLAALPSAGSRLHAAPPAWHGIGTWPVRAYALVEDET